MTWSLARTDSPPSIIVRRFVREALPYLAAGTGIVAIMLSPGAEFLEARSLSFHMTLEHLGFVSGGYLLSVGSEKLVLTLFVGAKRSVGMRSIVSIYVEVIRANRRLNSHAKLGLPSIAILLAYWHIPEIFNAAVLYDVLHSQMHVSFIIVGVIVFLNMKNVSRTGQLWHLLALVHAMLAGAVILLTSSEHYYVTYPLSQQAELGLVMAVPHPFVLAFVVLYLFSRYVWDK